MAKEKKKRKNRRAYLDNFQKGAAGEYVYTGNYYRYSGTQEAWRRKRAWLFGLNAAATAAWVICGCIPAGGMQGSFYVLLPWVAGICADVLLFAALLRLGREQAHIREYVWQEVRRRLPRRAVAAALLAAAACAGELLWLFLHAVGERPGASLLFLLLQAAAAAAVWRERQIFIGMEWEKE